MRSMNTREMVLFAVLAVLGLTAGYYAWSSWEGAEEAAEAKTQETTEMLASAAGIPEVHVVENSDLPKIRRNLRNLFNYSKSPEDLERERLEAERRRLLEEEARRRREEEERRRRELAASQANKIEPEKPKGPPPPNVRFLGYIGEPTDKIAVFAERGSGGGGDVSLVREGGVLNDNFKVIEIGFESVILGYMDPQWGDRTRTLQMGG